MHRLITLAATAALMFVLASSASAQAGRNAAPGAQPPDMTRQMAQTGRLCRADTGGFSLWWSEAPGGRHTVQGADGNCRTVPPVVRASGAALVRGQAALRTMGYPVVYGDAAPRFQPQPAVFRNLRSMRPQTRARWLSGIRRANRGRMLASLTVAQRQVVNRGLPQRLRALMAQDLRTALAGRPADFIGGSRRIDVVLTADPAMLSGPAGYAQCRTNPSRRGADRFIGASMVVLTDDAVPKFTTLAHEFFHVVQCNMGAIRNSALLTEGSAEWASTRIDPTAFAEAVRATAGGYGVSGGTARSVGFCRDFDPSATMSTDPYRSFAVWAALEAAEPGITRRTILAAVARPRTTADAVMSQVGDVRWSRALAAAVRSVCGELRIPGSPVPLPSEARGFIALGVGAGPGSAASITVPAGGVRSATLQWDWDQPAPTFLVTSPQMSPDALAGQLVANTRTAPLPVTPTPSGVLVTVPPELIGDGSGSITAASPGIRTPLALTVTMIG